MGPFKQDYNHSDQPAPHISRTKDIINKHPEIKKLMGRNPQTIYYIMGIVAFQIAIAWLMKDLAWYWVLATAWIIGAFANHALFVLIHECTHNLVMKSRTGNLWAGILCDLPNAFPSSAGFRKYHLKHHAFQGHYELDADIPSRWEAKIFGANFFTKSLWLLFFPLFQGLRPARLREIQFTNKWIIVNLVTVVLFDIAILVLFGPMALLYLVLSFVFSVGLHPLGGRWIQEHYLVAPPQETYSYYGPLNKVAFNVGYHNEHHDFSFIPWNNLPKVKAMAPEFYDHLVYHKSWSKLTWEFLVNGDLTLFSRTLRTDRAGIEVTGSSEDDFNEGIKKNETLVEA